MIIKDTLHLHTMIWLRVISGTPRRIPLATCIFSSMTVDTKLIWICLCRLLRKVIVQATLNQNLTLLKFTRIAISRRNQDLVTDGDHVTTQFSIDLDYYYAINVTHFAVLMNFALGTIINTPRIWKRNIYHLTVTWINMTDDDHSMCL